MPRLPLFGDRKKQTDLRLGRILTGRFRLPRYYQVTASVRSFHMYVVGKTGKGKSKFLQHCILSDIEGGNGCGVIDPHGDLIQETLANLYQRGFLGGDRARKVVYIDPTDRHTIVPFNVLAAPQQATPDEVHQIARHVITTIKRAWKETLSAAPNFEDVMEHALILLIRSGRTLVDLPRLFDPDTGFRDGLLDQVGDPRLDSFFYGRMSHRGAPERAESTLNKISPLRNNPHLELMLGQSENALDFRHFMDEGYVVLINLARCGEASQELFGNFFSHGFEQAALSRDDAPKDARRPFYLYIDEFQDFSAASARAFSRILSGARKYGLSLTLANQYLGQLAKADLLEAVFGNIGTKVFFGMSEFDALRLAPAVGLGYVDPEAIKHEAHTEVQHPVYQPLMEQQAVLAEELANQSVAQATIRDHEGRKIRIRTMPIPDTDFLTPEVFNEVVPRYGIPYDEAVRNLNRDDEVDTMGQGDFIQAETHKL